MIGISDRDRFTDCIIGQNDDNDYGESGYVIVVDGEWAAISAYSHCSCYDTWDDLTTKDTVRWDWTGSIEQLRVMVVEQRCTDMPDRIAREDDNDFDHLVEAYRQAREWLAKNRPLPYSAT